MSEQHLQMSDPPADPPAERRGFRHRVAAWGWRRALYWQLMHTLARTLGFHLHYVRISADRHDLRIANRPEVAPGYLTRRGSKADLLAFAGRIPDLDVAFVEEAFARGDECIVTLHQDDLVGFNFTSRSRAPVTAQLDVIVPRGFRYGYKGWSHPDHRRRNLSQMRTYFRSAHTDFPFEERSIHYVETHNYASLLRTRRSPSERAIDVGFIGWITVLGKQIPFTTRKARWAGLELVRRDDHRPRQYVR